MDYATLVRQAQMTPAEIKVALPITYIMDQAGYPVIEADDDGRLHCLCPFHSDSAPSFDIFGNRWGCYPCGFGGDALDLLGRFVEPSWTFSQLIDWAGELIARMPADWAASATAEFVKREFDPRQALTRVDASQVDDFVLHSIAEHYGWPDATWLKDRWRVGSEWSQVLIPYYRRDGSLATFKRRGVGTKALSAPGGKLCLYGEWLDQDWDKPVLLCEGESDTWTADRALGGTHAVLGVPGAGWTPPSFSDLVCMEGRQVILSFDGDDAGRAGMKTWAALITEAGGSPETWNIPDGQDIRSYLTQ